MNYVFLAVTVFKQIGVVYLISKQFTKKRALLKYQNQRVIFTFFPGYFVILECSCKTSYKKRSKSGIAAFLKSN
jgi:hypothetical protein